MRRRRLAWSWLLAVASGCAAPVPESELVVDGRFRIDGVVDKEHRGRFLFDTGFTRTTLNAASVARWKLPVHDGPTLHATDATGTRRSIDRFARVGCLRLGETPFAPFDAPVVDFPQWLRVDGVIGMDAISALAWVVDVPKGRLCSVNPDRLERRLAELYPGARWITVPLRDVGSGWQVEAELLGPEGSATATLRLDTGAESCSLPEATAAALQLPDGQVTRQHGLDREAEELRRELKTRGLVAEVTLGLDTRTVGMFGQESSTWRLLDGLRLANATVGPLLITESGDRPGLLGADVLGKVVWALDGPKNRMLVRVE